MLRTGGSFSHIRLTSSVQFCFSLLLLAVFSWGAFSSGMYIFHQDILNAKDNNVTEARGAYHELLSEVAIYRDRILAITEELDKNHKYSVNLVKDSKKHKKTNLSSSLTAERAKVLRERKLLKAEIKYLQGKMADILKGKIWHVLDKDSVEFELRKVVLQRDLAVIERKKLKKAVEELEHLVAEMQETQMQVYERVGELADGGISTLEKTLSGISKPLKKRGLTIKKIIAKGQKSLGQGGPFIPEKLPDLKDDDLNLKLSVINDKIDLWDNLIKLKHVIPVGKPYKHNIRVTSSFGVRTDPFNGKRARHEGVDLAGRNGSPVYVTASGKVVRAGKWGWYGNAIEIEHEMGFRTRYAHLKKIFVKRGDVVDIGAKIGLFGSTGRSSGSHLHYEIRIDGKPVNPIRFVRVEKNVFKAK
ncbi:MAG: M23 family metallopeptidase [Alphaproteobacteria bacterium]|nr:M23 family metallopeptidase [Alphaproteobacteria bacterium]